MKRTMLILGLIVIFISGFPKDGFRASGNYETVLYDGIDKRIAQIKKYLANNLTSKEFKTLSFQDAVIHSKDSTVFFGKIPFKDKKRPGFIMIKKTRIGFQYAEISMTGYHYKDSVMKDKKTIVIISGRAPGFSRKFLVNYGGRVEKVIYPQPKMGIRDTIYGVIPFLLDDGTAGVDRTYINANLIFDSIDSLNNDAFTKGIIIHDLIPLAYKSAPSIELEFGNWSILKPVNLDSIFKKLDNKQ